MPINPQLSGVRNITRDAAELYVTVDSSTSPLNIAARTSGPFTSGSEVIDAATAGDIDASNWGEIVTTPVIGESTKALTGLPDSTQYYYGYVQEDVPAPSFPFIPTFPNTTPQAGRFVVTPQSGGIIAPGGEIDTYILTGDQPRNSFYDYRTTRSNDGGAIGTLVSGSTYTVYQLAKRNPGVQFGRYIHIGVDGYGYETVTGTVRASVDLEGDLTPVLNSNWPTDWGATTPVVIDAGEYTADGNVGWVWLSLTFTVVPGHVFTTTDFVRLFSSDDPDDHVVLNSGGTGADVGFIYSDATPTTFQRRAEFVSGTFTTAGDGIVYTLVPNADNTQRTNYPDGDYVPPLYLPAPLNLRIDQITSSSMRVQWDYPTSGTDADGFELQRWITGTSTSWTSHPASTPNPGVGVRQSVESGLPPSTVIRFRIRAKNG